MNGFFTEIKVFNSSIFKKGTLIEISGYDNEGVDISGTYFIAKVLNNKLELDGYCNDLETFISPFIYVEDVEKGNINIHVYEKIPVPFPHS